LLEIQEFQATSGIIIKTPTPRNPINSKKPEEAASPEPTEDIQIFEGPKR